MGGRELDQHVLLGSAVTAGQARAASVHIADRIAAEHPHPLDDGYPTLAGQAIARDPAVRRDLGELLDLLGLKPA